MDTPTDTFKPTPPAKHLVADNLFARTSFRTRQADTTKTPTTKSTPRKQPNTGTQKQNHPNNDT
jgi:hypothetical protein